MFTLELTKEEMKTLLMIANVVGGSPRNSPRMHMDSIHDKLSVYIDKLDGFSGRDCRVDGYLDGGIMFKDFAIETIVTRKPF